MRLSEAIATFIRRTGGQAARHVGPTDYSRTLELLGEYCADSRISAIDELTGARLSDFLRRWYVEQASSNLNDIPAPGLLLETLARLINWIDEHVRPGYEAKRLPVMRGLDESLPRALALYSALSGCLAERGGAFGFPEFLTSFEEGGRSLYDIDAPGDAGACEGYFRVLRVGGESAEVEDLITGDHIGPVIFPSEVAAIICAGYIINLEMVRSPSGWQIAGCGFVYPPETEI